jgi:hypothetical protein
MESAMRMQYSPISLLRKDVRGDMMSSKRIKNSSTKTLRAPYAPLVNSVSGKPLFTPKIPVVCMGFAVCTDSLEEASSPTAAMGEKGISYLA